ncbi:MAG: hypothetical protein IT576_08900, partial [Verrucomicrobiales bacterium]|nr:hypothetical protein [Verrucomicrobiales bacterium]
ARAGAEGRAISLCDEQSQSLLRQIERTIRTSVPVDRSHPFHREPLSTDARNAPPQQGGGRRGGGGGGQRQGQSRNGGRRREAASSR